MARCKGSFSASSLRHSSTLSQAWISASCAGSTYSSAIFGSQYDQASLIKKFQHPLNPTFLRTKARKRIFQQPTIKPDQVPVFWQFGKQFSRLVREIY